jgi:ubiquinone/menaquinone biosynthesis C-methylase UbiE
MAIKKPIGDKKTSWGGVASWYNDLLQKGDTYQKSVILPKLLSLINIKQGQKIADVACGQGFFSTEFAKQGAVVYGFDISPELITFAKEQKIQNTHFSVAPAHRLTELADSSMDVVTIILALQNIEKAEDVFKECARVLKPKGKMYLVLNHPAFRIPQKSDWGYDTKKKVQYRKVEQYLSESMIKITMNPGEKDAKKKKYTTSFHRPISFYINALSRNNLYVRTLAEWISHKISQSGPQKAVEDRARKEIPLFMCIEAIKE